MNFLVMCCVLTVVALLSVVSLKVALKSKPVIEKLSSELGEAVKTVTFYKNQSEYLSSGLQQALDGMQYYKDESIKWYENYEIEHNLNLELKEEVRLLNTSVKNLEFIVGRMDGKKIFRDTEGNITEVRLVK